MSDFRPSRFQILPTVVKNLIIINAIMALAQTVLVRYKIDLADYLGLHYWGSSLFRPWQLITHMFMHGSAGDINLTLMHLFSNMFALWIFGSVLENIWGPKRFLLFYLVCGLGAALLHLTVLGYQFSVIDKAFHHFQLNPTLDQYNLFLQQHVHQALNPQSYNLLELQRAWENNPGDLGASRQAVNTLHQYIHGYTLSSPRLYLPGIYDEATVGASGAVFGVLFAFGYLFPNTYLYLYFLFPIKAKYFVAAYAAFELFSGIRNSAGDNVAHFAHLGGMAFAFIFLKIWNKKNRKTFF